MKLIDGKKIASEMREEMKVDVEKLTAKGKKPGLCGILVGNNPASETYVNMKAKACDKIGMYVEINRKEDSITEEELLTLIEEKNKDEKIHGILVQLPLPKHIDSSKVLKAISPEKDVDGFHPMSVGRLVLNEPGFKSCTPYGIIKMLERENIEIEGKHAVIIGRSNIVGKPIALMLLHKNATVTICHSRTKNLAEMTKQADILIAAIGRKDFVTEGMVKEGAVVIDVGINRVDGKLYGDVAFDAVKGKTSYITPVPGGVGPMTITMLLYNTIESAKNS